MTLKNKIIGITIGIRFQRSFRIPDVSGDIVDDILHDSASHFRNNIFNIVQENTTREKYIFNNSTNEYLRVNTNNVILCIKVQDKFNKKFEWVRDDVFGYFGKVLFKTYGIKNIQHAGIIFHHRFEHHKSLDSIVTSLSKGAISRDIEDISISFAKKLPVADSLYGKSVEDYKNTIYNLIEYRRSIYADFDFQYYYKPEIEDLRMGFTQKICDDALEYLENNFYPWLSSYANENKRS